MLGRRKLLAGLLAAPLVVRDYSVLMPVRRVLMPAKWKDLYPMFGGYSNYEIESLDNRSGLIVNWRIIPTDAASTAEAARFFTSLVVAA